MKVDKVDNIKDFPGYYISREGFLYSRYDKVGRLTDTYKRNKTYVRSNGYVQGVLKTRKENRLRRVYIHRLVAETYIPNPYNNPCVGHRDNNRENNSVENLYWCTHKENTQQCIDDGRMNFRPKLQFLLFSDLHISDYKKFPSREHSGFRVLDIISQRCEKLGVPAVHVGDLIHRPEIISNELLYRLIKEFNQLSHRKWKLYSISGNHCISTRSEIGHKPISWDRTLSMIYPWFKCIDYKRVHVDKCYIYGIPYIDHNIGLSKYISELKLTGSKRSKHILLLHTDYPGAKDTDGTVVNSVENLNINSISKFDLTLCGHIHKPQRLGKKVYMVGSPYQQRRTDKNCELGYWEVYSDMSLKFIPLNDFPKFVDVSSEDEIKDDGNYYTVIASKSRVVAVEDTPQINRELTKKSMVRRYMKAKGIKDKEKKATLLKVIKEAE